MEAVLNELKEAQRFAAIGTDEALVISKRHVTNADFYVKQLNKALALNNEDANSDLTST